MAVTLGISGGPAASSRARVLGQIAQESGRETTYLRSDGSIGVWESDGGIGAATGDRLESVYSCVRVITDAMMSLPVAVWEDEQQHPRILAHLLRRPNLYDTWTSFVEVMVRAYLLWGNAFAFVERGPGGRVENLWPLEPERMSAVLEGDGDAERLVYSNEAKRWPQDPRLPDIVHVYMNALPDYPRWGRSPITLLRETVEQGHFAAMYSRRMYTQGGSAREALATDQALDDKTAHDLAQQFHEATRGPSKWHVTPALTHGLKPVPLTMSHQDMAFIESVKLTRELIASAYQVPPVRIGAYERATFSNVRSQKRSFAANCIEPITRRFESVFHRVLLLDHPRYQFRFDLAGLTKAEPEELTQISAVQHEHGVITPRQWAERAGLPIEEANPPSDDYHEYAGGAGGKGLPNEDNDEKDPANKD